MKVIACIGYHDTGAGVVDDLLRECDNITQGRSNAEIRVVHDPDGITDLEYHLVKDPHRLGSSLAIRRFLDYCKRQSRQEEKLVGPEWYSKSKQYADSLISINYHGWLWSDVQFFPYLKRKYLWFKRAINHFLPTKYRKHPWYNFLPNETTFFANLTEADFVDKTKKYIDWICKQMNPSNKEFLVIDQFASAHNPGMTAKYVDGFKAIVVDRDPRDLFIHDVKILNEHILANDVKNFAIQYRLMRRKVVEDNPSLVLRVHYEDLIYKYDETVAKIFDFLEINPSTHHVAPKTHFNPAISINGTRMWLRYPQYSEEVKYLEKELSDMLYPYPQNADEIRERLITGKNVKELETAFKHIDDL